MNCMQHTLVERPVLGVPRPVSVLTRRGLASDADLAAVCSSASDVLALRVIVGTGGCRCGGPGPDMVAIDPADPLLPVSQATAVRALGPGIALADKTWSHLAGGEIALTGRSLAVLVVDLSGADSAAAPLVITLVDLAASLSASRLEHNPTMVTVLVRDAASSVIPAGWTQVAAGMASVGLAVGLGATPELAHVQGCAA